MQLSPDAFNGFLIGVGQQFAWRQSFACPCVNPASGAAKPNCPLCNGKGQMWAAEVAGIAGMTSQNQKKGFANFGTWEPGDAVLTVGSDSPLYGAGQYDRFRAINSTQRFSQIVVPGQNDKLLGTIKSVSRVFWLNTAGDTAIDGGIPAINADGSMTWTSGAPPADTTFSISGVKYDEFYLYLALPSNRNEHQGAELPQKLPVRKFDLFGR
ncbi:MAG TPA: hypothetical protein DEQ40_08120 [Oxalobacteraceae bacterium]|nr:hypothetical protein [Oxalobacteraceae bacterium]